MLLDLVLDRLIFNMIDQTDKEAEFYRDMVIKQANHIETMKLDMAELTDSYYKLLKRVDELGLECNNLRAQLNIKSYWDSNDVPTLR